uniref:Deoxyuridine 5'-triphosphate nucleotidohydrolase n=1 Tax=Myotis myotis TaxID=51298 RepID=A0A7J7VHC3_MYOMY|nr:hypothetical protein mMyoMyo1_004194 [Myotis myotis]
MLNKILLRVPRESWPRAVPGPPTGVRRRAACSSCIVRLWEYATSRTKGSVHGYDLSSAYDYTMPHMEKTLLKTDIQVALPSGCYGRGAPCSSLAAKHFIDVGAGIIDEDYRGNLGVVLFNFGKENFEVKMVTELHSSFVNVFFIQK